MMSPADRVSFSIITVTRNAARHLSASLDSVAMQTHGAVEHIVVDGASTDDTATVVRRHGARVTRFLSEPDDGIYEAMNKGIQIASGDYVLFLGADDRLVDPKVLSDVADFLQRETMPDLVYGDLEVREETRDAHVFRPPPPSEALDFLVYGCLPHQSTVAKREIFDKKVGPFDSRYRVHGDYDWYLRAFGADGVRIRYMPRTIGSFSMGGTSSHLRKGQEEFYAIQNAFPLYRQPEWIERRLREFQRQALNYRLEAQELKTTRYVIPGASLIRRAVRKLSRVLGQK